MKEKGFTWLFVDRDWELVHMDFRLLAKLVDIVKLNKDESPVRVTTSNTESFTTPVNVTASTTESSEIEEILTAITTAESIVTTVMKFIL